MKKTITITPEEISRDYDPSEIIDRSIMTVQAEAYRLAIKEIVDEKLKKKEFKPVTKQ